MGSFKIGFVGTSELSYIFLEALLEDMRFTVPFVITKPDLNKKRTGLMQYLSNQSLMVYTDDINKIDPSIYDQLDCVLVIAYGEKIATELLLRSRWLNVHGSILPQLRGASPIQYAIALGFETTGLSLAVMTDKMDAGPIISNIKHTIGVGDTFGSLSRRMGYDSREWLKTSLIAFLSGKLTPTEQEGQVTRAPIIKKEWTVLDWLQSAESIDRKVRALNPAPLAVTEVYGVYCKVVAGLLGAKQDVAPGQIASGTRLVFQTGTVSFRVTTLIPAGRKVMSDEEFLRGLRP